MTYKKRGALQCSDAQKAQLEKISKSRTEQKRRIQRAIIFLRYMAKVPIAQIAKEVGLSRQRVYASIDKALAFGPITALEDLSGRGTPAVITDDAKAWVTSLGCESPKNHGYTYEVWTIALLARHVRQHCVEKNHPSLQKAGKSLIYGILNKEGIKPHKIKYYLERRDEHFEEKMAQVLTVYKQVEIVNNDEAKNPENRELRKSTTISYDEKPGIQAIKNISAQLLPVAGKHATVSRDYEYKRLGTLSLLAGIDLHTGICIPSVENRHRSSEFVKFLEKLKASYPDDWIIRVILDNHSSHRSKETMRYLETVPGKFEFIFTPTHGSWLNMIEMYFSKLSRSILRHIRVDSKDELKERILNGIEDSNQEPVVFKWKYKMDEIMIES